MQIERRKPLTARVGILAVGHAVYWGQFDGLRDELMSKHDTFITRVRGVGVSVEIFGMIDDAEAAYTAVKGIKAADLDLLFIHMVTYATSSTFGVLARELDVPMVLVALQPRAALDYEHGSTYMQLCNDDICSVPEFTGVALRMGRPAPPVIIGMQDNDPIAEAEIAEWCAIARVLHDLRRARLGHLGHVLEAMLDMHTDPSAITAAFGCHVVQCEPDEILRAYRSADDATVRAKLADIRAFFDCPDPQSDPITSKASDKDVETAARVAVALDAFITARRLDGLAYYYEADAGSEMRTVVTNLIVGNSLLCAAGFPMCGEYDIKTCIAMLIMDRLEIGGSLAEFHPIDFERDTVLVGHDGPHHLNIADGKPVLRSLDRYHGKPGAGAGVEFQIKEGPITMLSIGVTAAGRFKFILAEGESIRWPIPPTGNTNTHGKFAPDVRTFLTRWVSAGPTHHFALGIGHKARAISRVADCLGIESVIVTPTA
jgi:L-arabinose isomerase